MVVMQVSSQPPLKLVQSPVGISEHVTQSFPTTAKKRAPRYSGTAHHVNGLHRDARCVFARCDELGAWKDNRQKDKDIRDVTTRTVPLSSRGGLVVPSVADAFVARANADTCPKASGGIRQLHATPCGCLTVPCPRLSTWGDGLGRG